MTDPVTGHQDTEEWRIRWVPGLGWEVDGPRVQTPWNGWQAVIAKPRVLPYQGEPTDEEIERAAKAMWDAGSRCYPWNLADADCQEALEQVRIGLRAAREDPK